MPRRLTFLTRADCGLCDDALAKLQTVLRFLPITIDVVDIHSDTTLESDYHLRIPVVLDRRGRVVAEGQIGTIAALRAGVSALF